MWIKYNKYCFIDFIRFSSHNLRKQNFKTEGKSRLGRKGKRQLHIIRYAIYAHLRNKLIFISF